MYTHLITAGCSFTDSSYSKQWPVFLAEQLDCEMHDTAKVSQGNQQIARRLIQRLTSLLESGVHPSNMLVGIVWSGTDRTEFFKNQVQPDIRYEGEFETSPVVNSGDGAQGGWRILNAVFSSPYAVNYSGTYHNPIGAVIKTYESIHWVQTFLKLHNIDYFMCTFMNEVFEHGYDQNPNVNWIQQQIDYSKFLPVRSYHDIFNPDNLIYRHPTEDESRHFSIDHILPFVTNMYTHKL